MQEVMISIKMGKMSAIMALEWLVPRPHLRGWSVWVVWYKHRELTDRDWENAIQGLGKVSGLSGKWAMVDPGKGPGPLPYFWTKPKIYIF